MYSVAHLRENGKLSVLCTEQCEDTDSVGPGEEASRAGLCTSGVSLPLRIYDYPPNSRETKKNIFTSNFTCKVSDLVKNSLFYNMNIKINF